MTGLDAPRIRTLLEELGRRLHGRGIEAQLYLVGGAAMAMAYDRDRLTRDLDAVFVPKAEVYAQARAMAAESGDLDPDWLNDAVKGLMPSRPDDGALTQFSAPGIVVQVASARYLLAMKVYAARVERDADDILTLCRLLGITSGEAALGVAQEVYGAGVLPPRSQFLVQELLSRGGPDQE